MAGSSSSVSSSTGSSQSTSQSFIPDYSETPILEAIALQAQQMSTTVYNWGMDQFNKTQGNIDALMRDALSYASPQRISTDMGMAESGVAQAGEAGRQSTITDLQSYGIDPSSGRYAALDEANRVMTAASAAGAGNQQRMADIAAGNAMRNQAISAEEQNNTFGLGVGNSANAFLNTGMQLKYPPLGTKSQSTSQNRSQSVSQSVNTTEAGGGAQPKAPSGGGGGGGGGSPSSGGGKAPGTTGGGSPPGIVHPPTTPSTGPGGNKPGQGPGGDQPGTPEPQPPVDPNLPPDNPLQTLPPEDEGLPPDLPDTPPPSDQSGAPQVDESGFDQAYPPDQSGAPQVDEGGFDNPDSYVDEPPDPTQGVEQQPMGPVDAAPGYPAGPVDSSPLPDLPADPGAQPFVGAGASNTGYQPYAGDPTAFAGMPQNVDPTTGLPVDPNDPNNQNTQVASADPAGGYFGLLGGAWDTMAGAASDAIGNIGQYVSNAVSPTSAYGADNPPVPTAADLPAIPDPTTDTTNFTDPSSLSGYDPLSYTNPYTSALADAAAYDPSSYYDPSTYDPSSYDPSYSDPYSDPSYSDPYSDPSYSDPYSDPSYSDPSYDPSSYYDPSTYDPSSYDPSYSDPYSDPSYSDPYSDPSYSDPYSDQSYSDPYSDPSYDPSSYDPSSYDPSSYDPSSYDPSSYDPSSYDPSYDDPYSDPGYDASSYDPGSGGDGSGDGGDDYARGGPVRPPRRPRMPFPPPGPRRPPHLRPPMRTGSLPRPMPMRRPPPGVPRTQQGAPMPSRRGPPPGARMLGNFISPNGMTPPVSGGTPIGRPTMAPRVARAPQQQFAGGGQVADPTTGGFVSRNLSPSAGAKTDDVNARLNAGEFVIPRDVAAYKGKEFFYKLIAQARKLRSAAGKPEQSKVGYAGGGPFNQPMQRPAPMVQRPPMQPMAPRPSPRPAFQQAPQQRPTGIQ